MSVVYILIVVVILMLVVLIIRNNELFVSLKHKVDNLNKEVNRIEASVTNEIATNRNESARTARDAREEMGNSLRSFGKLISSSAETTSALQRDQLQTFSNNLNTLTKSLEERLREATEANTRN